MALPAIAEVRWPKSLREVQVGPLAPIFLCPVSLDKFAARTVLT
jgi:hypothetical protein